MEQRRIPIPAEVHDGIFLRSQSRFSFPSHLSSPDELKDRAVNITAPEWVHTLVGNIADGFVATDPEGRITFINAAAEEMTGLSPAIGGLQLAEAIRLLDEHSGEEIHFPSAGTSRAERSEAPLCGVLAHRDGSRRYVQHRLVDVRDSHGDLLGRALIMRDLTKEKMAENLVQDADRRKDEFLATLAHELRNPLAPIRNALHILKLAAHNPPIADQAREMMERQVQQMVRLVDDLLDVSRISRGKIELHKERVELVSLINSALETSKPLFEEAGHDLMVSLPSQPLLLECDPTRLAQALSNLLNNAAKYTEPGGKIYLVVRRQNDEIIITVRDTGIGIPADMLARIFDMFTQVPQSSKRYQGGLGIGLTLVKSLVQMHGGVVEARSEGSGKGTEVSIRLPVSLSTPETPPPQAVEEFRLPGQGRLKILVADDNRDSADSLGKMLSMLGYEIQTVADGPTALSMFLVFQPDLAILDIGMPGMSGLEVAQQIRQHPEGRDVLLVALTGWGQEEVRRRSREVGFDAHLVKPVDPEELTRLLAQITSRR